MKTESFIQGKAFVQEYNAGKPLYDVKEIENKSGKIHGTIQTFRPDISIFPDVNINDKQVLRRIREQAYLTGNILFTFKDERSDSFNLPYNIYFEGGAKSYVRTLDKEKKSYNRYNTYKKRIGRNLC